MKLTAFWFRTRTVEIERKFIWKHKQISLHIELPTANFTNILRKNRQNLKTFKMWSHFNSNNIKNENFQYKNEK